MASSRARRASGSSPGGAGTRAEVDPPADGSPRLDERCRLPATTTREERQLVGNAESQSERLRSAHKSAIPYLRGS